MKTILTGSSPRELSLYADSAVGRDVQPLFIPDEREDWRLTLAPAIRVGRLGKCIPEKFALRYIDAIGIVGLMHPGSVSLIPGQVPGWLSLMDSAVTTGAWMEEWDETDLPAGAARAVAIASEFSTLKTGDVIIPALGEAPEHILKPDILITATLGGRQALRIKVK
ncbi:MAG: hypothetical protein NC102_11035 [Clostridium sp.]|nr:hypothetical protein [Clostridium sp.]